jgi:hypothetical protein
MPVERSKTGPNAVAPPDWSDSWTIFGPTLRDHISAAKHRRRDVLTAALDAGTLAKGGRRELLEIRASIELDVERAATDRNGRYRLAMAGLAARTPEQILADQRPLNERVADRIEGARRRVAKRDARLDAERRAKGVEEAAERLVEEIVKPTIERRMFETGRRHVTMPETDSVTRPPKPPWKPEWGVFRPFGRSRGPSLRILSAIPTDEELDELDDEE